MVADFLYRKTMPGSVFSQVRVEISTQSYSNFGLKHRGSGGWLSSGYDVPVSGLAGQQREGRHAALFPLRHDLGRCFPELRPRPLPVMHARAGTGLEHEPEVTSSRRTESPIGRTRSRRATSCTIAAAHAAIPPPCHTELESRIGAAEEQGIVRHRLPPDPRIKRPRG
jgi:hypothetical protein